MRTVTIANHKGGVGKTTTAYTLGAGLRAKGYKVLLIDLDPQTNLGFTADVDLKESDYRLYNVFKGTQKTIDCIYQIDNDLEDFDILVGGVSLLNADAEFSKKDLLKKALKGLENSYDFVVIDTPPNLGILTQNAIVVSDDLIIPLKADVYSLQGLGSIQGIIEECNPDINISGLLMVGVNERTNLSKELMKVFKTEAKKLNSKVFKTMIRNSVVIPESQLNKTSIFNHAPSAKVTQDYTDFISEYLKGAKYGRPKK
jgi:chromosome partitioning protein